MRIDGGGAPDILIQFEIFNTCYSIFEADIEHQLLFLPIIYLAARLDVFLLNID